MAIVGMPPPYQVASTIQEILQRRREESRQAMLDKLQHDRFSAERGFEEQRLGLEGRRVASEESRAKDAALLNEVQRRQAEEGIVSSQLSSMGDIEREITPEWKAAQPALYNELVKRQRIRQDTVTPKTTSSYEAQLPAGATPEQIEEFAAAAQGQEGTVDVAGPPQTREMFTGSPEFQRTRYAQDQLRGAAADPSLTPEMRQFLTVQASGAQGVPGQLLGDRTAHIYNWTGRRTGEQKLGPYDEIIQTPQPYQPAVALQPKEYQEMDGRTGRPVRTHALAPWQLSQATAEAAARGNLLVETTSPFVPGQGAERAKDLAARAFAQAFTSNAPRTQRNAELNQARANLIASTIVSNPAISNYLNVVSQDLLQAADAQGGVPGDIAGPILQSIKANFPQMTPADEAEVTETLNLLLTNLPKTAAPARSAAPAAPIAARPRGAGPGPVGR